MKKEKVLTPENGWNKCEICQKTFSYLSNLHSHLKEVHAGRERKYECSPCNQFFVRKEHLQMHQESKHLNIRYECLECGKKFTQKLGLNLHKANVHEGIRFKCEQCEKLFSGKSNLQNHIK